VWRRTPLFYVTILATLCIKGLTTTTQYSSWAVCRGDICYLRLSSLFMKHGVGAVASRCTR